MTSTVYHNIILLVLNVQFRQSLRIVTVFLTPTVSLVTKGLFDFDILLVKS